MDGSEEATESTSRMSFEMRNGIEMVPGTVQLVDCKGLASLQSTDSRAQTAHQRSPSTSVLNHHFRNASKILLIPQPSSDPDDPLNWSLARKECHFGLLLTWGFLVAASINWSGPVWVTLQHDLKTTLDNMNISSAICFAFLGLGCILLQPAAMKLGRRPVYILGTSLNLIGCIIGGFQRTIEIYYVVNILTGFGASPVDSLVQISTTDLFFAHERGTRLSIFAFALGAGSYLGPVAAGHISQSQGWRWCFWYLAMFFGILLIFQIFTLEETMFARPPLQLERELVNENTQVGVDSEKSNSVAKDETENGTPSPDTNTVSNLAGQHTYRQRMELIHTRHANMKPWWFLALSPFRLITFPAILWTGIMGGIQTMWLSLLSVTQSELFSAAPYNFSIAAVGDTNLSAFIGGIFGMIIGGPLSDWWILREAKRNKGIFEPESRLWLLILPTVFNTIGLLMYGVGAYKGELWIISAGIGTALLGFSIGSAGAICLTYAIDCYPGVAAESMVLILFLRDVIGFGFTFAIQPWVDAQGGVTVTMVLALFCLASMMSFHIMIAKGKSFRMRTAKCYLQYSEERFRSG